jgi:transglutaminase-like putative cysteine protease
MNRRFLVVHRTGFRYDAPVRASYNEARMTPLTTATQTALDTRLEVDPVTWRHTYLDYWGTPVTAFDVLVPHAELTVVSRSTVEVMTAPERTAAVLDWADLGRDDVRDPYTEYLAQTDWTRPDAEVTELAHGTVAGLAPDAAAQAICTAVFDTLDYVAGATSVHTKAAEVWRARKGVCQDFAHFTVGALREVGIPARYVSGYLHPAPEAGIGETVEGQSHAWVEWWAGEWVAYDPTHDAPAGVDHVVVARGRDYSDVAPLKGVYAGTGGSQLFVSVQVTRLA